MPSLKEEIVRLLADRPGLTDREIMDRLKGTSVPQQPVNIACRQLERAGALRRLRDRPDGLIGNYPVIEAGTAQISNRPPTKANPGNNATDELSEDDLKKLLSSWLERQGWSVEVSWGHARGVDISASKRRERWIIEAKGCGSRQPMRVNYFLAILGETLQRMEDRGARYSIALPNMAQFRGLWRRLPDLAKRRTGITALLIDATGEVREER